MYLGKVIKENEKSDGSIIVIYKAVRDNPNFVEYEEGRDMLVGLRYYKRNFSFMENGNLLEFNDVFVCILPMYHGKKFPYLSNLYDYYNPSNEVLNIVKDYKYFPFFYVDMNKRLFMDMVEKSSSFIKKEIWVRNLTF